MQLALALALVIAAPMQVHEAVHPVSPRHLVVRLDASAEPGSLRDGWTLSSDDDPAYAVAQPPDGVALKRWAADLDPDGGWPYPNTPAWEVVLALPERLTPGATYLIDHAAGAGRWELEFEPTRTWTPALAVNQVGYVTAAPARYAYASYWVVDLDPVVVRPGEGAFAVVDEATGEEVHVGTLGLRLAHDQATEDAYGTNYSRANVYEAALGPLAHAGTYHVVWKGVGRSPPFVVAEGIYDAPFRAVFRALYHQRCGTALTAELTRWTHPACHTQPVVLSDWDLHSEGSPFDQLPAHATGQEVQVRGGYHDAGDYDRRIPHLVVVDALVDLYDLFPERFARDDLGLPESGNGVPDVLDEAVWALDLYAQLQDESGGVRGGVETTGHPGGWDVPPEEDTQTTWYAYGIDPRSSYRFAGGSAKLAGALAGTAGADHAAEWLERARRAFAWAEAHRPADGVGWLDAYAAAELLKATAEAEFDLAFQQRGPFSNGDVSFSLADWDSDEVVPALFAYVRAPAATEPYRSAARRVLVQRADAMLRAAQGTGHRLVKHPYAPVGFGSLTTPRGAGLLFRMHALTGAPAYLEWGMHTCDVTLGANAAGRSWVTSLGSSPVARPLHLPSMTDGVDEPVPGLTVYGPSRAEESAGVMGAALAALEPPADAWPLAERYVDVAYVPGYSEFTVHESIAPTVFAFGYLARLAGTGPPDVADAGAPADAARAPDAGATTDAWVREDAGPSPGAEVREDAGAPAASPPAERPSGCDCGQLPGAPSGRGPGWPRLLRASLRR